MTELYYGLMVTGLVSLVSLAYEISIEKKKLDSDEYSIY